VIRRLARVLLASVFISGGADALRQPGGRVGPAERVGVPVARKLPLPLPEDPEILVRVNGAVQLAAGVALATNRLPRLAALVLVGSLVPTTLAGHPFWEVTDPAARKQQQVQFSKNLAMLGGLLQVAVDSGSRPSVFWRTGRAARAIGAVAKGQPVTGVRKVAAAVTG